MNNFTLTIIGSGEALPLYDRHPSEQIIQHDIFVVSSIVEKEPLITRH